MTLFLWFSCEQRDTNGLTAENSELKLRLQTMEQQVHLQDGNGLTLLFIISVLVLILNASINEWFFFPVLILSEMQMVIIGH